MIRSVMALACLALAGCDAQIGGPQLLSAQSPPAPMSHNSQPQSPNSLPPGAQVDAAGPTATAPNYASVTLALPR